MVAETELRSGAIGLPSVLMQSITCIAPALGLWFVVQFLAGVAGVTAPLALLLGALLMLMTAVPLAQLARHFPSAGGYYTYISRTVDPRIGFLVGWIFFLYQPMCCSINPPFMGKIFQDLLKAEYGIDFPWWAFMAISVVFLAFVAYRGIKFSAKVLVILGVIEILIVLALGISGLLFPGSGGFNFSSFNPANAPNFHGLFLGVVGALLVLAGWEGAVPLAEESENPRRTVPRAVIGSVIILCVLQVISSWGITVGWGTNNVASFISSGVIPPFVLAHKLWGPLWLLAPFALLNSNMALIVSCMNVSTRMTYGMARSGSLPAFFAKIHPKYKTPVNAIHAQMIVMIVVGFGLGFWLGPLTEYFLIALTFTFALILIYSAGNLGVFLYHFRERRQEFNWLLHAVFPAVSTAGLLTVGYFSAVPLPPAPITYAPVVLVVWILVGIGVLVYFKSTGREQWIAKAIQSANERVETAEELAHRPGI